VRDYADLSFGIDAVIHAFFVDGALRGAASYGPSAHRSRARRKPRSRSRSHGKVTASAPAARGTLLPRANRGLKFLHMACLADTGECSSSRVSTSRAELDFSNVVASRNRRPTPISLMREILADSHGFATAMLDVRRECSGRRENGGHHAVSG